MTLMDRRNVTPFRVIDPKPKAFEKYPVRPRLTEDDIVDGCSANIYRAAYQHGIRPRRFTGKVFIAGAVVVAAIVASVFLSIH
jgi:hypothetical protein